MKITWKISLLTASLTLLIWQCLNSSSQAQSASGDANVCMMVFQLADNNLESFIRQDVFELTQSPAVQDSSVVTWIYFDARNLGAADGSDILDPLVGVYNADGTPLTEKFEGSRYFTWSHSQARMVIDTILPDEQDSDNPDTLIAFVVHALTDCVAKGTKEFMMIFSSHGGGYAGFGMDENERRILNYQSNLSILTALQDALASVPGAPGQLDVLGFDACLMQSADALDEYREIAKYYMASEATEPAHGWAYAQLDVVDSALSMAKNLFHNFLESTHGMDYHQYPKTMSIVDTASFVVFQSSWEALCAEMTRLLQGNDDPDFVANLKRARTKAVSFFGSLDEPTVKVPAPMDIGSFLQMFDKFCNPVSTSHLRTLLDQAFIAYSAMFVETGVGEGTPAGTGMHILWVSQDEYSRDKPLYQPIIFGETTDELPNYLVFLSTFYDTPTPNILNSTSPVCPISLDPGRLPVDEFELLIDPDLYFPGSHAEIGSQVTRNVDFVFVEYGINVTNLLSEDLGRRLLHTVRENDARRLLAGNKEPPRPRSRRLKHGQMHRSRRDQEGGDIFLIYGGDVSIAYDGAIVAAAWDRIFYWLESGSIAEPVYVYDYGNGAKSIPVCYFGPDNPITKEDIPIGTLVEDAISTMGCHEGYITFSISNASDAIGLYVYQGDGSGADVLSQIPSFIGGQIVPIIHVEFNVAGVQVNKLLGGFESFIIDWGVGSDLVVYAVDDARTLELFESKLAFVDIFAYDFDTNIFDYEIFPFTVEIPSSIEVSDARSRNSGGWVSGIIAMSILFIQSNTS